MQSPQHASLLMWYGCSHTCAFLFVVPVEGWPDVDPEELMGRFRAQKRMVLGEALDLIERARNVFRKEPNILQLKTPVIGA